MVSITVTLHIPTRVVSVPIFSSMSSSRFLVVSKRNAVKDPTDFLLDGRCALLPLGSLGYGDSQQMGPERNT